MEATPKDLEAVEKAGPQQRMTEFGRTLYSMMLTRAVEHKGELLRLLNEGGYRISQSGLSYYFNGGRAVDPLFFACVCSLLRLNKQERQQLAWAYANGQLKRTPEQERLVEGFRNILEG